MSPIPVPGRPAMVETHISGSIAAPLTMGGSAFFVPSVFGSGFTLTVSFSGFVPTSTALDC